MRRHGNAAARQCGGTAMRRHGNAAVDALPGSRPVAGARRGGRRAQAGAMWGVIRRSTRQPAGGWRHRGRPAPRARAGEPFGEQAGQAADSDERGARSIRRPEHGETTGEHRWARSMGATAQRSAAGGASCVGSASVVAPGAHRVGCEPG
jgi:hypothetical protein